jgi:hypothetical protein
MTQLHRKNKQRELVQSGHRKSENMGNLGTAIDRGRGGGKSRGTGRGRGSSRRTGRQEKSISHISL